MSNQFSYELDERQIKFLMQDAELECNEALWGKFETIESTSDCSSSSVKIGSYIPRINLSISRSVVVPILFIVLIGGLSAMLFSFVDFKKKENIDKEIPLVANPENFKKPEIKIAKTTAPAVVKTKPVSVSVNTTSTSVPAKVEQPLKTTPAEPEVNTLKPEKVIELTKVETVKPIASERTKETTSQPIKKKKKKKVVAEELPTIKVTTNLNEGVNEPELDLDLK